jgi:hypothetical protein
MMSDDLEPSIHARSLPEEVSRRRALAERYYERAWPMVKPRIEAHLATYSLAVDALAGAHRRVAEETDLDLTASTRWTAVWEMSGRCLALAYALLTQLRAGHCGEALATARTLHEADRLLDVASWKDAKSPGMMTSQSSHSSTPPPPAAPSILQTDDLLRRWLVDDDKTWVRPKQVRSALDNLERRIGKEMQSAGHQPPPATLPMSQTLYDRLSRAGHNRRGAVRGDAVSVELRLMVYGPHPDPVVRGVYVFWGGAMIEESVLAVGAALMHFYGGEFFRGEVAPLRDAIQAIRKTMPLDPRELEAFRR